MAPRSLRLMNSPDSVGLENWRSDSMSGGVLIGNSKKKQSAVRIIGALISHSDEAFYLKNSVIDPLRIF